MLIFIVGMTSLHCIAPQTTEIQIDDHLLSTPFASIIGKKEYSFSSKNGPKGVLLFPHYWTKRSGHQSGHQFLSLVYEVQSGLVIPFFASTESQEFNYGIGARNRTRHCALRHFLRPDLYLCCLWSNLGLSYHFLHLHNLRNSVMASASATERGIVL